jgi:hypothetical protein
MFIRFQGQKSGRGVPMVGRGYYHNVYIFAFKGFSEVCISFGSCILPFLYDLLTFYNGPAVHVTDMDYMEIVLTGKILGQRLPAAIDAHHGDI